MSTDTDVFDAAVWAAVEGAASETELALLEASPREHRRTLERLIAEAEGRLDDAEQLRGAERDQVVADLEDELDRLEDALEVIAPPPPKREPKPQPKPRPDLPPQPKREPGPVQLQASWLRGRIVVWGAGRDTPGEDNDALADRLEGIDAPPLGWEIHAPVALPGGHKADALAIPVREALGWLAVLREHPGIGPSVIWIARVAVAAIRLVAQGRMAPVVKGEVRKDGRSRDLAVRWVPAAVDEDEVAQLARSMPPPVTHLAKADPRVVTRDILAAVTHAIATEAASGLQFAAPPPTTRTPAQIAEAITTRLDGSGFTAPAGAATDITRRLDTWAKPVTSQARRRVVVNLDPPDNDNAWFLSILAAKTADQNKSGNLVPIEQALMADPAGTKALDAELLRLERMIPALLRPGALRRGQVYLSQDEAWTLMTVTGEALTNSGFEVRVPNLQRRKPKPTLRLNAIAGKKTSVGADQISDVRWSAVFDDVELTAADIRRLAGEARPLVQSRGAWVELDRADLREAAAALAERADKTKLTGAEILRHSLGLEGGGLAGGITVEGDSWATDLLAKASATSTAPVTKPRGFKGTLRAYQAEALGWLGFLEATGLGGCLALDMGLGKTPTVLAHLLARKKAGPSLVIAPAAVVGNWAAEALRFTPTLKVAIHHGASRAATKKELDAELKKADVLITTYGTAVRDVDALAKREWNVLVLDEAQAIKSHTTETATQLRRIEATTKFALTGTPIENGLGDLWSILDFTNPGLVGNRPSFIASLSGDAGGEAALRALNGILVFRRTKAEPEVAAELPDRIDELDHCTMTAEQIGLYQAVLDGLVPADGSEDAKPKQGAILAAITALKQICNHPAAYSGDDGPLHGRSGKLDRLEEIVDAVFAAGEKLLVFTHFAEWGKRLADHLSEVTGVPIDCYHGGLTRPVRDRMIEEFQSRDGAGALVLSLKAGGTGLNLTAASHVVLYDRWWNPAVEDQARDRAWRIGQTRTVVSHRLVCPGTVDERVEEVVEGKRHIADIVLPKSSSLAALDADQLRVALGLDAKTLLTDEDV